MLRLRHLLLSNKPFYIVLIIAITITTIRINIKQKSILSKNTSAVTGTITSIKYNGNSLTLVIKLNTKEQLQCYYYIKKEKELLKLKKDLKLGMKIKLYGTLNDIPNKQVDNTFSYKNYLKIKHIYYTFTIDSLSIIDKNTNLFYSTKNLILRYLNNYKTGSYIKMLLLGDTTLVSNKIIDSFRDNGISHLFAISGTQVTVLAEAILRLLKKLKIKEKERYIIVNIFIFIYMFLTGSPPAILRAVLFFSLSSINKYNYFFITNLNLFILTLSITILINPFYIYDLGFLYSYLISMALIICSNILENKTYFKQLLLTSIISFLISIPITLYNFYQLNFLSIIYNLFYVPFVNNLLFPLAIISIFFFPLDYLLYLLIIVLEKSSLYISNISIGKIVFPKLNIIYYILYIIILYSLYRYRKRIIKYILVLLFLFHYSYNYIFNYNYVYVFSIGQGDSILLHISNSNILIDTGGKQKYEYEEWMKKESNSLTVNTLIPFFKSKGIKQLDYLILTHGDFDHMGEATNLVNNFKVDKVIFNCGEYNGLEKELIKVLEKKKTNYYSCIKELNIDKNKLYFLQTKIYDNENDNSNVIYTNLNGYKLMFMGDASVTTEKEILNKYNLPDIDVLKVGHHGSKTSSSAEFINEINPIYSIISVGKNNRYGHPNKEVLDNLNNSKIYMTDENGSIMFKIKNNKLKIETCSP